MIDQPVNIKAQLGCGTLIIIAIIVMLFSGGNESRQLRRELDDVNRKLDRLEQKIDDLSKKLGPAPSSTPAPPRVRSGSRAQYLQLVRSAPGGAVFSARSIPFGMNIW